MRGERCHEDSVQQGPGQLFSPGFRREPVRLVLRYVRCRSDVCRIGRLGLFDPPEQVSNSRNFREVLLGNPKSQNALEFEAQVQPFQRVDAEIELWVRSPTSSRASHIGLAGRATPPLSASPKLTSLDAGGGVEEQNPDPLASRS